MLEGLVQHDHPLTLQAALMRMRQVVGHAEVVTLTDEGVTSASYAEVADRAERLAAGLADLGVRPGDRVATFSWNTQAHLEAYMAIPSMGAVLHTLNLRLFEEQLLYIVNHAQDKVIIVDSSLVELLEKVADRLDSVEHYIVVGDGDTGALEPVTRYEDLLGAHDSFDWPAIDDRSASGLCYTSGTTGNPKGVLYSHRSAILHAVMCMTADALGVCATDRVMPVVPMFHANAWGLPHAAVLAGADLVMPNRFLQGEPLAKLIESERVTVTGAVPTIFMDMLRYVDANETDLSSLRQVACGGAAVPLSLMRAFEERHGVRITQAWGMTETSPVATAAQEPRGAEGEERWRYRATAGRVLPLLEVRLIGDDGQEVPWDGESTGEVQIRGPWVASTYYEDPSGDDKFDDGWLRTGDIASMDDHGYMRISDRSKDVIKSGGEWISSVDLENELMAHPDVQEAAVVAMPDEKWSERPLACVVCTEGAEMDPAALREHLASRVAKWWMPDAFAEIDEVPKTSTGKFDKKVLRGRLADGDLEVKRVAGEAEAEPTRS
jgi:acyl-CoA synthetase (AMP-forming)/AMP-acid ligase II